MSKVKVLMVLLICILLFASGVYVFSRLAGRKPPNTNPVSDWPNIGPTSPASTPSAPPAAPFAKAGTPPARKESLAAEPRFLLRQGETLEYNANLPKLNSTIADLKIVASEKRNADSKGGAWHLQAFAHTENPYRMVFPLDDQFDSYSNDGSMTSLQYEMHLNERGQKVDSIERMLASPSDPPPEGASAVRVPPGTRDPLGMLQYLRSVDWNSISEVRSPVFDGRKLYDVRAVLVDKATPVNVPAGNFNTTKIELHVSDNGTEMKDAHFLLYLTNDTSRLPVLLEAVLPVATARVELTKTH
ncbi:MAG: DUF3108 domain-containing protein [Candidatus Acidiferrum sp.]